MKQLSRQKHIEWCQKRALEYLEGNKTDINQAWASFGSDMSKHPETHRHRALKDGFLMLASGQLDTPDKMRRFIKGFN